MTTTTAQIISTLAEGKLTVEVAQTELPEPKGSQILVKMEAAPINPSDLAVLTGPADLAGAEYSPGRFVADMPEPFYSGQKARHGMRLPVGNEGAGEVVAAGDDEYAQSLIGQRVACVPGTAYSEYCIADAMLSLPLGELSSEQGASAFVNPMTALGFVETARAAGQNAIIHTAAASNLGQMLLKICQEDDIALVNIVRKSEQADMLRDMGATHVVNSADEDFFSQLCAAIEETGAYFGFDPIGGGQMTDTCFRAMEQVAARNMSEYSRYGSDQAKKMFIYGRLDLGPTILTPAYGFGWTLSGWLLTPFLQQAGMETVLRMRQRVLEGLTTTFASSYKRKVNLEEMLTREAVLEYSQMKTGEKYLVTP
ncbi:NADH oxidase [Halioglobus sp. HI00S01]|uniref:zinc-binding dehydrogenase n=1 Tax=Halioglobus sp. HI00S01 TaxID=1822214 RepID=UPI0007C3B5B1|nr:zinc-binding dehydrogenase [Halioglobus sp. HI00S01]KZX58744.1 NADH oxidase [Halioglobus sp. HI00S01]